MINSRRYFIKAGIAGGAGLALASQLDCGGKSVSGTVTIIAGAVEELQILFPSVPALAQALKLAKDFNADWTAGKFDSARKFFENLDTIVGQVISDLGVNASTRVKLLLATLGIAVRTIAALINEQAQTVSTLAGKARTANPRTADRVDELASAAVADRLLATVRGIGSH